MAFFGLGKNRNKKTRKSSRNPAPTTGKPEATVSVFANMDKIRSLQNGQDKWDNYAETLTYPHKSITLEGEDGYIITLPHNDAALRIRDEINGIMGQRRAAKFVAAEDYSSTSLPID